LLINQEKREEMTLQGDNYEDVVVVVASSIPPSYEMTSTQATSSYGEYGTNGDGDYRYT
jgi:hypothetical protein